MSDTVSENIEQIVQCYHCGEDCPSKDITLDGHVFCCNGCRTVYEILDQNNLCQYYSIDETPGISRKEAHQRNYDFLDDPDLQKSLVDFSDDKFTTLTFTIPQMHCSSCIWILENLQKFNRGILHSQVNFLKKTLRLQFLHNEVSIKEIVILLDSLGYEPELNLSEKQKDAVEEENKKLYYRIGVAGFAFGNIMLLSFPEYLGGKSSAGNLQWLFNYLNLLLALPVVFFSASPYFESSIKGLKKKIVNVDVPISLGIAAIFLRSSFDILTGAGAGYFDSMTALVFFLLVGKLFQNKTYDSLNFERNYKSYFPIAVNILREGKETSIPVSKIKLKDRLIIRSDEIIPADSILIRGDAHIDYSFVTGESAPVDKLPGDMIYAGGRQAGGIIEVDVVKEVSQSYLTRLWNNKIFDKKYDSPIDTLTNTVSKYFTFVILTIASGALLYWSVFDPSLALYSFTSVLIIACPCALALASPFTMGNSLRILGRNKIYLKNTSVIEKLAGIKHIVFDKTGTLTIVSKSNVEFDGSELSEYEKSLVKTLTRNSSHPLSRKIYKLYKKSNLLEIKDFTEEPGKGISAVVAGSTVKIGSSLFVKRETGDDAGYSVSSGTSSKVFLEINNRRRGFFVVKNVYREGLTQVLKELKKFKFTVLSGDSSGEKETLKNIFPAGTELLFNQDPFGKLNYIKEKAAENENVLMLGDGLNDAGALKQSTVGISISENINNFSPASDGIIEAEKFNLIPKLLKFSSISKSIIISSFLLSFIYNFIGLSFAVSGSLSPVVAAILMPLSSISVVLYTTLTVNFSAKKIGL